MYEDFYGMKKTPFTRGMQSDALYLSSESIEVLNRLTYVTQRQLFFVLTGDCGTGKTTLLRKFRDRLDPNQYRFLYLSDAQLTPRDFYRLLLEQMGCTAKYNRSDAKRQLHEEMEKMKAIHGIQPICVCDECHLMSRDMLEEIRFLLNTQFDSKSPMPLIFVGQTELWHKLQQQAYAAIRQRIDIQSALNHYDRAQTGAYIQTQISYSGLSKEIFTKAAMDAIHQYTAGTARLIDKVCSSLLLYGSQNRLQLLDDHAVQLVLECEFS